MRVAWFVLVTSVVVAAPPVPFSTNSLMRYSGTWQVTRKTPTASTKPDTLLNQCGLLGKFFACSQSVNGAPSGLLVFIPASGDGHFYTQTIMPDGRATGRDDLQISGDVWTYSSRRDQDGRTTFYRTTNTFSGNRQIHFESAHSSNNRDWTVDSSGDDAKAGAGR